MANDKEHEKRGESNPEAKRTGREAPDPHGLPGEFADDMRANRSTPPPDPPLKKK